MQVITAGPGAAAACTRALASNHLLCLLCDRLVSGAAGVEVEFFGERTVLPAGPVTLALRTGATLLPCAVYFGQASNDHLGVIRPPLALTRQGRLRDDVQAWTQVLAGELEELIRRAPTQWHLMQPNWPGDRDGVLGLGGWGSWSTGREAGTWDAPGWAWSTWGLPDWGWSGRGWPGPGLSRPGASGRPAARSQSSRRRSPNGGSPVRPKQGK
jgi:hypothetical protein